MDELISKQAAVGAIEKLCEECDSTWCGECRIKYPDKDARSVLKSLPSAEPQIIRCKDCKHRDKYGCCKYWKGLAMADIPIATDDNDFCSRAERKDNG